MSYGVGEASYVDIDVNAEAVIDDACADADDDDDDDADVVEEQFAHMGGLVV